MRGPWSNPYNALLDKQIKQELINRSQTSSPANMSTQSNQSQTMNLTQDQLNTNLAAYMMQVQSKQDQVQGNLFQSHMNMHRF